MSVNIMIIMYGYICLELIQNISGLMNGWYHMFKLGQLCRIISPLNNIPKSAGRVYPVCVFLSLIHDDHKDTANVYHYLNHKIYVIQLQWLHPFFP